MSKTFTTYWAFQNFYHGQAGQNPNTSTEDGTVRFTFTVSDGSIASQTIDVATTQAAENGLLKATVSCRAATDGQEIKVVATRLIPSGLSNSLLSPLAATLDSAPTRLITRNVPMTSDAQGELMAAKPGDTLVFPDGYKWTGHVVLVPRPIILDGSSHPLHQKVRAAGVNLAYSQRIKMSETSVTWTTPDTAPALAGYGPQIGYWDFDGIRTASLNNSSNGTNYRQVDFGPINATIDHTSTSENSLPHDMTFGHMIVHGRDFTPGAGQTILNGWSQFQGIHISILNVVLSDSLITNFIWPSNGSGDPTQGQETQGLLLSGTKHGLIINNEISASGENIMMYTAYLNISTAEAAMVPVGTGASGMMPDDIRITGNWVHKLTEWIALRYTKNLIECKNCRNVEMDHNVMEYSFEGYFSDGQWGGSFAIANRNGGGDPTKPWAWNHDLYIHDNYQSHQGSCVSAPGPYDDAWHAPAPGDTSTGNVTDDGGPQVPMLSDAIAAGMGKMNNMKYVNNLCDDISIVWTTASGNYPNVIPAKYATGLRLGNVTGTLVNLIARNNTFTHRETKAGTLVPGATLYGLTYNSYTPTSDFISSTHPSVWNLTRSGGLPSPGNNAIYDKNVFSIGAPLCDGGGYFLCFQDVAGTTWTNNVMRNISSTISDYTSFYSINESANPGHYSGNVLSADSSALIGAGIGADVAVLTAARPAIIAGNR